MKMKMKEMMIKMKEMKKNLMKEMPIRFLMIMDLLIMMMSKRD